MSFCERFLEYNWEEISDLIYSATSQDVERALCKNSKRSLHDFAALISPAASGYLENLAALSQAITRRRFGNTIQMYVPVYLSNECQNICTYCGFSVNNKIPRLTLNDTQLRKELEIVSNFGYEHLLLVSGEANKTVGADYFQNAIQIAREYFTHVALEVQPLTAAEYRQLAGSGLSTVLVYQETYNRELYKIYHPRGRKAKFDYRLETPDRVASAGLHRIGLGALLGLADWRVDAFFVALHLSYLEKTYWQTKYTISFPRIRPASGSIEPRVVVSDRELLQLICAYRVFNENVELSLSTRESQRFRDNVIKLGVTSLSAGSRTEPGGYANPDGALEQFEISDQRSPAEMAQVISAAGLQPVWKDWERSFNSDGS